VSGRVETALPLLLAYPRLTQRVPWVSLGCWPTPVTEARHFAEQHGLARLYLKREDQTHPECGGNKVRGLEFTLAEAVGRGARSIVTIGAAGSHHVACTAWHARPLGLKTVVIVTQQPPAEYVRRNLLLGASLGVDYVPVNTATLLPKLAARLVGSRLSGEGRAYYLPPGGTSPLACLGHVNAALELKQQIDAGIMPEPDYLYVALGSLGTAAGLAVGCRLAGLRTRLVGVVASYRWYCTAGRWARLARRTLRLMQGLDPSVPDISVHRRELSVVGTALGRGYAEPTEFSLRLAEEMQSAEGIELDGTYTAKALHGMMQFIARYGLHDRTHLFWHTYFPPPAITPDAERIAKLPAVLRRYL
jgi:D-cysteine desulfhydrase